VFRDPLSILTRESNPAPVAMVAPAFTARVEVAPRPGGSAARLGDGVLELPGHGLRVAVRDVVAIDVLPALGGRLQLRLAYRRGADTVRRRCWMPAAEHDALAGVVRQVRAAAGARA
jgi:hypothetical protein